jgi:hypothetical protein
MLTGLYGSVYRQFRKLQDGPLKVLFTSMLLFIVVRGFAEAEPFDLQLPLWAIVLIGFLANDIAQISPSTITLGAQSGWDSEEQSSLPIAKPFAPAG